MTKQIRRAKAMKRWFKREMKKSWWLVIVYWALFALKIAAYTALPSQGWIPAGIKWAIGSTLYFMPIILTMMVYIVSKRIRERRKKHS